MTSNEQQRHAPPQERRQEESRRESAPASQPRTADPASLHEASSTQKGQSSIGVEAAQITAGKDGAQNIRVKWIDVPLRNATPVRFAVTTAAGNTLEVSMEQQSYRKSYQGTSSLQTDITPVAPHGTKGRLTVHDLTTGETLEQPWKWRWSGGGLSGLWELLKRLFT
jgi:hypothetical protein